MSSFHNSMFLLHQANLQDIKMRAINYNTAILAPLLLN